MTSRSRTSWISGRPMQDARADVMSLGRMERFSPDSVVVEVLQSPSVSR